MRSGTVLNFVFFVCFLVVGYSVSTRTYQADEAIAAGIDIVGINRPAGVQSLNNGQRSILLIGVDSLDQSMPGLTSIWLVSQLPPDSTLHMSPIFPAGKATFSDFEQRLQRSFGLEKSSRSLAPSQGFFNLLTENNYWWSGYFLYDQAAQLKMIDLLTGGIGAISENPGLKWSTSMGDFQDAFTDQLAVLQIACHHLDDFIRDPAWLQVLSQVPGHTLTDIDLQQYVKEWRTSLSSQEVPSCRFPTLEISWNDY